MKQAAGGGRVQDATCHVHPTVSGPTLYPIGVGVTCDNWAVMLDDPSLDCRWLVISGDGDGHGASLSEGVDVNDVNGCRWHQPSQRLGMSFSLSDGHQGHVEGDDAAIAFSGQCVVFHGVYPVQ